LRTLRVLADRPENVARFLLLGSASPALFRHVGETLAGRAHLIEMGGFTVEETGFVNLERLWLRGTFPRSYLHATDADSLEWRRAFIRTFLVRDVPHWTEVRQDERALYRFLEWAAQYHGQSWNNSEVGAQLGLSYKTIQRLVDIFTECFVLRQLRPYARNPGIRLRKAPKLYFRDAGLFHHFAGIDRPDALRINPKSGPSWEGFALDQVLRMLSLPEERCFHWSKHSGAEIDLVVERGGRLYGLEFKLTEQPKVTVSIRTGLDELALEHLWIVTPTEHTIELDKKITAVGLNQLDAIRSHLEAR
jgi:predicted AAA+ superfamily ATPase